MLSNIILDWIVRVANVMPVIAAEFSFFKFHYFNQFFLNF